MAGSLKAQRYVVQSTIFSKLYKRSIVILPMLLSLMYSCRLRLEYKEHLQDLSAECRCVPVREVFCTTETSPAADRPQ